MHQIDMGRAETFGNEVKWRFLTDSLNLGMTAMLCWLVVWCVITPVISRAFPAVAQTSRSRGAVPRRRRSWEGSAGNGVAGQGVRQAPELARNTSPAPWSCCFLARGSGEGREGTWRSQVLRFGTSKVPFEYPRAVQLALSSPAFIRPGSAANEIYLSGFSVL